MNIIGIDPSLISTGLVISTKNGMKIYNYCRESDATLSKGGLSKWFKLCEGKIELRFIKYRKFETYSEGELVKIKDYDYITDMIINDIKTNIDTSIQTKVGIEGYSFGSQVGDLVDLVAFSTILRKKIWDHITKDITVFSPSTLKQESCKITYKPIDIGKKKPKFVYKNNEGVAGGKFTKREIFLSIIENGNLNDDWASLCKSLKDEMLENKTIKKPWEDINDSYMICNILNNSK